MVTNIIEEKKENVATVTIPGELVSMLIGKASGFPLRAASRPRSGESGGAARVRINDERRCVA
jgi:hypothetical protein|tara:strand:+ start:170 stop:358 length:189 start_codon:yes stop_codon:yes gene_type:complete